MVLSPCLDLQVPSDTTRRPGSNSFSLTGSCHPNVTQGNQEKRKGGIKEAWARVWSPGFESLLCTHFTDAASEAQRGKAIWLHSYSEEHKRQEPGPKCFAGEELPASLLGKERHAVWELTAVGGLGEGLSFTARA